MRTALLILSLLLIFSCKKLEMEAVTGSCTNEGEINPDHSKASLLFQKISDIQLEGIPGISIAILDKEGYWAGAAGFAKLEDQTRMQACHLQYGQSIAKTYMAVAILLLYEEGSISLDKKATSYLPVEYTSKIKGIEEVTVRMLLNHTSGLAEYNDKPEYVTYLLQHPLHKFTTADYIDFIENKPVKFKAGTSYSYTNTNYELLAVIADQITGDHKKFIQEKILIPLQLTNTYYYNPPFLQHPDLVNSYWDRFSNGEIENCTEMQKNNVGTLIGDDGIIATPVDYIKFLKALMTNEILNESTMEEMQDFVPTKEGSDNGYGLGIHRKYYKGFPDIGHTGGGIGSGSLLGYFPDNDLYYFVGINMGTSIYSPNFDNLEGKINEIYDILIGL